MVVAPPTLVDMSTPTENRRSFLADLSWFQVVAGVLAAMTSAWIASALGVAGTIIGAALGSLVVTISSAFYARTLDRGRTLVVQTDRGTVVEHDVAPGETVVAVAAAEEATGGTVQSTREVDDERRTVRWPLVAATTVVVLVVALLVMGGYEKLSGSSYGTGGDNARITNPFGGAPAPTATDDPADDGDAPDDTATPTPSSSATTPAPTASSPVPTATRTPTPTRSPTASATPDPAEE